MIQKLFISLLLVSTLLFAAGNKSKKTYELKKYELVIDGLKQLSSVDVAQALGAQKSSSLVFWNKEQLLPQEFLDTLEPTLKGYLESKGYFDAKYTIRRSGNKITIDIDEGKPILVTNISLHSDIDLKDIVTWKKGDIFESERFLQMKESIRARLLENGYCKSDLQTKAYVDLKLHSAKLDFNISKGSVCSFGKVQIKKKPKDIKRDVIYSRMAYKEGDRFDIRKIEQSYNQLNALNTFANIQIKDNLNDKNSTVDTELSLNKKEKLRRYMIAVGADSEIGFRLKASWEKRNFLHDAKRVLLQTALSAVKQNIQGQFFAPAIFNIKNHYLDLYVTAGVSREKTDAYIEKKLFLKSYFEYKYDHFTIQKGIGFEILGIDLKKSLPSIIGGRFNLLYPYIQAVYDTRDSKVDPKNGFYFKLYTEYGIASRADAIQYIKYFLEARAIKSFGDLTLSAVGKIGSIHELSGKLPASKLFYGGGVFSNRAYGKDKIGYITSKHTFSSLGGKSFVNLQLEANYKLYKKLYGAIFFDSTIISSKEYQFNGNRIDTVGFGLRYKTPIGPIKIDVGFNAHHSKDYAISVMLGQSF